MKLHEGEITPGKILISILGAAVTSFGVYNIHSISGISEGGILGLELLLLHWFGISPAITGAVTSAVCYYIGWRALKKKFLVGSIAATGAYSVFYAIFEHTPRLFPEIAEHPWLAALAGAAFIGIGSSMSMLCNAAQSGDDALALGLHTFFGWTVEKIYLVSDLVVLALSLSYIPWQKMIYSLLSVVLSGQIIGIACRIFRKE